MVRPQLPLLRCRTQEVFAFCIPLCHLVTLEAVSSGDELSRRDSPRVLTAVSPKNQQQGKGEGSVSKVLASQA